MFKGQPDEISVDTGFLQNSTNVSKSEGHCEWYPEPYFIVTFELFKSILQREF